MARVGRVQGATIDQSAMERKESPKCSTSNSEKSASLLDLLVTSASLLVTRFVVLCLQGGGRTSVAPVLPPFWVRWVRGQGWVLGHGLCPNLLFGCGPNLDHTLRLTFHESTWHGRMAFILVRRCYSTNRPGLHFHVCARLGLQHASNITSEGVI